MQLLGLVYLTTLWAMVGAVLNGTEAPNRSRLFVVGLRGSAASESRCGGSLIAPTVVLTSVTCAWATWASVGSHFSSGSSDGERIPIANVTLHPRFNRNTQEYNLALLHLKSPSAMPTIPLHWQSNITNTTAKNSTWIRGFASATTRHQLSNVLLEAHTQILSNAECAKFYGSAVKDSWVCVEANVHPDDIGGPLTIVDTTGHEFLVGVSSWGNDRNGPGVYARVASARDFIEPFLVKATTNQTNGTQAFDGADDADDDDGAIVAPE